MLEKKDQIEEHFWLLVSLKLAGEATPGDLSELESLLKTHPEWTLRMELFTNIWQQNHQKTGDENGEKTSETRETHFNRHLQRLSTHLANPVLQYEKPEKRENGEKTETPGKSIKRLAIRLTAIAAVLIGVIMIIGIYTRKSQSPGETQGYNTVSTRPGSRSKLQLPDGTLVYLNADSRLSYKIDDQNPNREVTLTGEAYFDVAKDKNHPFLIHTPIIDIRVLGTAFNVQCYRNDKHTETSLFQGSVEVTLKNNPDKKIVLQPSEKLIVQNDEMAVTNIKTKETDTDDPIITLGKVHYQQQDSSYTEMLWTKNKLAFDNRTLEEIAHQIERWYGAKVIFTDDKLRSTRFSGVFEDESLHQIMQALEMTGGFHYTIHKKEVTITP